MFCLLSVIIRLPITQRLGEPVMFPSYADYMPNTFRTFRFAENTFPRRKTGRISLAGRIEAFGWTKKS
jgi:hypothetical protein